MKLAVLLSLSLLACSVDGFAEKITGKIVQIFNTILKTVDKATEELTRQTKNVLSAAYRTIQKLREMALDTVQEVTDKMEDIIEEVIQKIKESVNGAKQYQVDIDDCTKLFENLNSTGTGIIENVKNCVVGKQEDFDDQIELVQMESENVLEELSTIKNESKQCLEKMNSSSILDVLSALTCVNGAAARASWAATKEVPTLFAQIGKLTFKIAALPESLSPCTFSEALRDYAIQAKIQADEINRCINKRIQAQTRLAN